LNISQISDLHYTQRVDADQSDILKKVRDCDLILFSGGKQLKLSSLSGRTNLIELIKERYYDEKKVVVAGTSAGAAAMSNTMIIAGSTEEALIKGSL